MAQRTWTSEQGWKSKSLVLTRRVIRSVTDYADLIIGPVTFNEDGLATAHAADFLTDPKFVRAYQLGKATGSWRESDIRWRCYVNCWAASHASHLEGDFVECGVYRGGFSRAVIDYVDLPSLGKTMYLLDTFEGLVEKYIGDADRAVGRRTGGYEDSYDAVVRTFEGLPVKIIKGAVPDTLPLVDSEKVAYLSLDMNCTPPEEAAIEFFWPRLVSGAVVVHDDYGHAGHAPQRKALNAFAASQGMEVLAMPTGQGLLFKP